MTNPTWQPPDVCLACGAVMVSKTPQYIDYLCGTTIDVEYGVDVGYDCLSNQLADYRRALEMVMHEFAQECHGTPESVPGEVAKYLAAALAARMGGE